MLFVEFGHANMGGNITTKYFDFLFSVDFFPSIFFLIFSSMLFIDCLSQCLSLFFIIHSPLPYITSGYLVSISQRTN